MCGFIYYSILSEHHYKLDKLEAAGTGNPVLEQNPVTKEEGSKMIVSGGVGRNDTLPEMSCRKGTKKAVEKLDTFSTQDQVTNSRTHSHSF